MAEAGFFDGLFDQHIACSARQSQSGSGAPDAQGAHARSLHPHSSAASRLARAQRRALPMAAALGTGVGFTGFFALASTLVEALCALLVGIACTAPAYAAERAALRPAGDAGPTLPIEAVLAEIQPEGTQTELVSDMAAAFPVATRGLRQAVLRRAASLPQSFARWLAQPIALVADDEASRRWLMQQGYALHALGASVLVVRVRSEERMRVMRGVRADLPMAPAAAPELVAALRAAGAAVYPLVIITDGTLRQDVRPLAVRQQAGRPGQAQTPSGGRSVYPPAGGPT